MSKHPVHLDLERVIDACTWFDDRGPVFPPTRVRPFVDERVEFGDKVVRRIVSRDRLLAAVVSASATGITCVECAQRMGADNQDTNGKLHDLRRAGKIVRKGPHGHPSSRWIAVEELAEAA